MDEQELEVTPEVTEEEEQVEPVDEVEAMRAELEKAKEIAENQRIRAEKAEAKAKTKPEQQSNVVLNAGDMMAIKNADLEPKDMDLVEKYAKDNNISLREAISHPHVKAILSYEAELRTTAIASNVDGVRRGTIKVTDDTLINNANANKLPTSDDEIERLIAARMKMK
jgi:hypothetical protein